MAIMNKFSVVCIVSSSCVTVSALQLRINKRSERLPLVSHDEKKYCGPRYGACDSCPFQPIWEELGYRAEINSAMELCDKSLEVVSKLNGVSTDRTYAELLEIVQSIKPEPSKESSPIPIKVATKESLEEMIKTIKGKFDKMKETYEGAAGDSKELGEETEKLLKKKCDEACKPLKLQIQNLCQVEFKKQLLELQENEEVGDLVNTGELQSAVEKLEKKYNTLTLRSGALSLDKKAEKVKDTVKVFAAILTGMLAISEKSMVLLEYGSTLVATKCGIACLAVVAVAAGVYVIRYKLNGEESNTSFIPFCNFGSSEEVEEAVKGLKDATKDVQDATKDVQNATKSLTEAAGEVKKHGGTMANGCSAMISAMKCVADWMRSDKPDDSQS